MTAKPLQRSDTAPIHSEWKWEKWEPERPSRRPYTPLFTASIPALFVTLSAKEIAAQFVALADTGDETAKRWLEKLLTDRKATVAELSLAERLDLRLFPTVAGNGIRWGAAFPSANSLRSRDTFYAWALIRILQNGLDRRIRRCRQKDCRKIFFGDIRARWCSPSCGSKDRVRRWRKENR